MDDVDDLIKGRVESPFLVVGGTPKKLYHRMEEKGSQLESASLSVEQMVKDNIFDAFNLDGLVVLLEKLEDLNVHFVGSKDHVYNSTKMRRIISGCREECYFSSWLPRTLGFREKALKLLKESEDARREG